MTNPARVAFVCEGDAETADTAFSGTAKSMVDHLRLLGHEIACVDSELYGWRRYLSAARSFSVDRQTWRARFHFGAGGFDARTRRAESRFSAVRGPVDVVLQIGATFKPPRRTEIPYALYCDWNWALTIQEKGAAQSPAFHLPRAEIEEIAAREADLYRNAAIIFTISEALRESFTKDYGISADRVITAHPGVNFDLASILPRTDRDESEHRPTIIFVGKDFERKGGDVLLEAFRIVRGQLPTARLRILGATVPGPPEPGVESLGMLRKSVPAEHDRLIEAYSTADVFCLPSRLDPFPNVVREAMAFGLPCVTTDIWAMPEMVVDGETGFTVPVEDPSALSDRLHFLLLNPSTARRFGEAGLRRVEERFTWTAAAKILHEGIERAALPTRR